MKIKTNQIENRKIEKINEAQTWVSEKMSKTDKPQARLAKNQREKHTYYELQG